ncbi:cytidylyltransferase domain-containing protein [Promineifilum sp.]|uniref:cytidylyltransferase domain-containing protein n=1 Tax=Promineifilum sp. TaxID=2664178 RepID=UPI0035B295D4
MQRRDDRQLGGGLATRPTVATIIQARTGSTRLPNKIMRPLAGAPLLTRMMDRVRAAALVGTVVVATTTEPADDPIEALCRAHGFACFRGDAADLLDRHYRAALWAVAAGGAVGDLAVVKIPSDCPLIDPRVIDRVIGFYFDHPGEYDYVSNLHPATYPDGNDVEIMPLAALETAWREARRPLEREHTTPYFWENPDRFRVGNVAWESGLDYSMSHRWTIDYEADYQFIRAVYEGLYAANPLFSLDDILAFLDAHPEVAAFNAEYAGVNWYRHHLDELRTVTEAQTRKSY